jgi:Family of unknown function (DUF6502)
LRFDRSLPEHGATVNNRALTPEADEALKHALEALLAPLAQLAVAHGLPFPAAEELFKRAYVDAARAMQTGGTGQRDISRVSMATGLNRREVTRLTEERPTAATQRRSPATEVFTRWRGDRSLHNKRGQPLPLPRQGEAPSFESLAHSVTRDVHPRSLLDELVRLGLVELSADGETVRLVSNAFVPRGDAIRMFSFLGSNVGDHLSASVANVLADAPPHFEQALFADELSAESLLAVRSLITTQWQALMQAVVPAVNALLDTDREAVQTSGRRADQRLRVGLYSYHEAMPASPSNESEES